MNTNTWSFVKVCKYTLLGWMTHAIVHILHVYEQKKMNVTYMVKGKVI